MLLATEINVARKKSLKVIAITRIQCFLAPFFQPLLIVFMGT